MTISRAIGNHEKNAKHSTAPIRNPCADTLRWTLRRRRPPASGREGRASSLTLVSVAASAIGSPDLPATGSRGPYEGAVREGRTRGPHEGAGPRAPAPVTALLAVGQDLVHLAGRIGQQL